MNTCTQKINSEKVEDDFNLNLIPFGSICSNFLLKLFGISNCESYTIKKTLKLLRLLYKLTPFNRIFLSNIPVNEQLSNHIYKKYIYSQQTNTPPGGQN